MMKWHEEAVRELLEQMEFQVVNGERTLISPAEAKMLMAAFDELMNLMPKPLEAADPRE